MSVRKIAISLLIYVALVCLICSGLLSCTASSKIKTAVKSNTDSVVAKKETTATTAHNDSVAIKTTDSSFTEEIIFNLQPLPADTAAQVWSNGNATDYFTPVQKRKGPFIYKVNGSIIQSDQPVSSVTIKTKGQVLKKDSTRVIKSDSSSSAKAETVQVKKLQTQTEVAKKTTRLFSWWWILVILTAAAGIYYALHHKNFFKDFLS
jgi:hypothetical protein